MKLVKLVTVLLAVDVLTMAQSDRARLIGTVYDPSGAVIPGATIQVTERLTQ